MARIKTKKVFNKGKLKRNRLRIYAFMVLWTYGSPKGKLDGFAIYKNSFVVRHNNRISKNKLAQLIVSQISYKVLRRNIDVRIFYKDFWTFKRYAANKTNPFLKRVTKANGNIQLLLNNEQFENVTLDSALRRYKKALKKFIANTKGFRPLNKKVMELILDSVSDE